MTRINEKAWREVRMNLEDWNHELGRLIIERYLQACDEIELEKELEEQVRFSR